MKIDNSVNSINTASGNDARVRAARNVNGPQAASGGAKVELSPLASRLQELESTMANAPVVDSAKVAEIKEAIAEGRFKVNPERIADGLIESVRQMLEVHGRKA
ncbi:MAG: flagellar biosynthesis anti-sigma factor FlgM [Betaproteobacteria bacterium]|nr:flagellar biosynthesis anti-sigma factor FlgM [Betaproteobacteria bacterium]